MEAESFYICPLEYRQNWKSLWTFWRSLFTTRKNISAFLAWNNIICLSLFSEAEVLCYEKKKGWPSSIKSTRWEDKEKSFSIEFIYSKEKQFKVKDSKWLQVRFILAKFVLQTLQNVAAGFQLTFKSTPSGFKFSGHIRFMVCKHKFVLLEFTI